MIKAWGQNVAPSLVEYQLQIGDLWIDTAGGDNKLYRWDGYYWQEMDTVHLNFLIDQLDNKTTVYYSSVAPQEPEKNDLWYDTTDPNSITIKRWTGTTWQDITDPTLGRALQAAGDAKSIADKKIKTFAQNNEPTEDLDFGDLWIDTDYNNRLYRWNGEKWIDYTDQHLEYLIDIVDGKTTTYYGEQPDNPAENDIWYDTASGLIKRYSGGIWVDITNNALKAALDAAGEAQAIADEKIETYAQDSEPTEASIGDLWIDTSTSDNDLYRYEYNPDDDDPYGWVPYNPPWRTEIGNASAALQSYVDQVKKEITDSYTGSINNLESIVKGWLNVDDNGNVLLVQQVQQQVTNSLGTSIEEVTNQYNDLIKYIRLSNGTITIGELNSPTSMELTKDMLAFKSTSPSTDTSVEPPPGTVAYVSRDIFYMGNAIVKKGGYLRLGNFSFRPEADDSLSFLKTGGRL